MVGTPSSNGNVAGTAPAARTATSRATAVVWLARYGIPWEMLVDSSAATGPPTASAAAIAATTRMVHF